MLQFPLFTTNTFNTTTSIKYSTITAIADLNLHNSLSGIKRNNNGLRQRRLSACIPAQAQTQTNQNRMAPLTLHLAFGINSGMNA
jgi:hypothetical protein